MGNSVLENCGVYTDRLIEIANNVKKQKITNGEPVNNQTIWGIENEIYEAYQTISSNFKDGGSIAKAIQYLENGVKNSGTTSNIKQLADTASQKVIEENKNIEFQKNIEGNSIAGAVVVATIDNSIVEKSNKILDNVFDEKAIIEMNVVLEKAKEGDVGANAEMQTIEAVTRFMGMNPTLEGNRDRAALLWLQRLEQCKSPAAQEILRKMAEQYREQLDVFEISEDGKENISSEKIQKLLEERIPEELRKKIDMKNIHHRVGERITRKGKYTGENSPQNATEILEEVKSAVSKGNIRRLVTEYAKQEDGFGKMEELYEKHPELVREILKQKIQACNSHQEVGRVGSNLSRLRKEVLILSQTIHSKEDRTTSQPKQGTQINKAKKVEDDDLSR